MFVWPNLLALAYRRMHADVGFPHICEVVADTEYVRLSG
jgi:hypothetical protein